MTRRGDPNEKKEFSCFSGKNAHCQKDDFFFYYYLLLKLSDLEIFKSFFFFSIENIYDSEDELIYDSRVKAAVSS